MYFSRCDARLIGNCCCISCGGSRLIVCSHRRRGRDKTKLSCLVCSCVHNSHRQRGQDYCIVLSHWRCEHNYRQDKKIKTVLSCPRRRCEQAISCKLETGSRRDKTHRNWAETRENCLVGGVNTIGDQTKLSCLVRIGGVNKP